MEKVCIIGNLNIDLIMGKFSELPQWGKEKVADILETRCAGQVGYIAKALASLGIKVSVIANLGDDHYGRLILEDLKKFGINIKGIKVLKDISTGITVALVNERGERAFLSYPGSMRYFTERDIEENWNLIEKADYVVLNGYFLLPDLCFESVKELFDKVRKLGKITVLDTGWDPADWPPAHISQIKEILSRTDIFLPNLDEARVLTGKDKVKDALRKLCFWSSGLVVIKMGEDGSIAIKDENIFYQGAFKTKILDTTGAGDTFNAGFLYGLMRGWNLDRVLKFANAFTSLHLCAQRGGYPTEEEVWSFIYKDS